MCSYKESGYLSNSALNKRLNWFFLKQKERRCISWISKILIKLTDLTRIFFKLPRNPKSTLFYSQIITKEMKEKANYKYNPITKQLALIIFQQVRRDEINFPFYNVNLQQFVPHLYIQNHQQQQQQNRRSNTTFWKFSPHYQTRDGFAWVSLHLITRGKQNITFQESHQLNKTGGWLWFVCTQSKFAHTHQPHITRTYTFYTLQEERVFWSTFTRKLICIFNFEIHSKHWMGPSRSSPHFVFRANCLPFNVNHTVNSNDFFIYWCCSVHMFLGRWMDGLDVICTMGGELWIKLDWKYCDQIKVTFYESFVLRITEIT